MYQQQHKIIAIVPYLHHTIISRHCNRGNVTIQLIVLVIYFFIHLLVQ